MADKSPIEDEVFDRFTKCVVDVLSVEADQVKLTANFAKDLSADSLDLVELVMALEEEFDVSIPEEELEGIETVDQAWKLLQGKLEKKEA